MYILIIILVVTFVVSDITVVLLMIPIMLVEFKWYNTIPSHVFVVFVSIFLIIFYSCVVQFVDFLILTLILVANQLIFVLAFKVRSCSLVAVLYSVVLCNSTGLHLFVTRILFNQNAILLMLAARQFFSKYYVILDRYYKYFCWT